MDFTHAFALKQTNVESWHLQVDEESMWNMIEECWKRTYGSRCMKCVQRHTADEATSAYIVDALKDNV